MKAPKWFQTHADHPNNHDRPIDDDMATTMSEAWRGDWQAHSSRNDNLLCDFFLPLEEEQMPVPSLAWRRCQSAPHTLHTPSLQPTEPVASTLPRVLSTKCPAIKEDECLTQIPSNNAAIHISISPPRPPIFDRLLSVPSRLDRVSGLRVIASPSPLLCQAPQSMTSFGSCLDVRLSILV
ncbi:hypothetical protein T484DRAFT_2027285 [Baffinella frigidus]|nr:hypothetical protein T484DRAFT_2027285 [Cryptophyta sp. CCMP2293]|mmetsp:Transcript_63396/g.145167  ORF Transcript_63396/g.145167 Transcript_63396/m.145167 type:complete len:180 (+) Transcript_63396:93-632(+)